MIKAFRFAAFLLCKVEEYIVVIAGMTAGTLLMAAAIMRYVLLIDFYGVEELILLCAFWLYFIGSALAARENSHLKADFIVSLMKTPKQKTVLAIVQHSVSFVICCYATLLTYRYVMFMTNLGPVTQALKLPMVWWQFPLFLGFLLMNIYILGHLIRNIRILIPGKEVAE